MFVLLMITTVVIARTNRRNKVSALARSCPGRIWHPAGPSPRPYEKPQYAEEPKHGRCPPAVLSCAFDQQTAPSETQSSAVRVPGCWHSAEGSIPESGCLTRAHR